MIFVMGTLRVRKATVDDRDTIVRVNMELATETENRELDKSTVSEGVDAVFADPNKGFYLVCEAKGEVAGGLLVTAEWSDWRNAWFWWIQSVYVFSEFRKRGVYSALHRHVEKLGRDQGDVCGIRLYVDNDNEQAKATYRKMGMKPGRYQLFDEPLP
jgi:ribosomal protein S18 acetylase RimI-like enzyme